MVSAVRERTAKKAKRIMIELIIGRLEVSSSAGGLERLTGRIYTFRQAVSTSAYNISKKRNHVIEPGWLF